MINYVYQLVAPRAFSVKYDEFEFGEYVIVKPTYLAICHADQRYYMGKRARSVLDKKLPMALIHEGCGTVIYDPSGKFHVGEQVVMIPNVPAENRDAVIAENYEKGSSFLSSGKDGFLQEYLSFSPDRLVSCEGIPVKIAAMTEFVSVAMHSISRFKNISHQKRNIIGVWGDGSLGFVTCELLKRLFPDSKIVLIGRNKRKMSYFSFVDETYLREELPNEFEVDHAFECCGGEGSSYAIDDIIRFINPQGTVMLMGVSENKIAVNTRDVLEKGLSFIGSSRSGRVDFENAINYMREKHMQKRLEMILYEDEPVKSIEGLHRVFETDTNTPFKTVFKWEL